MAKSYFNPTTPDIVIKSLFKKYDKDNSGFLDRKELSSLLTDDLGLTPRQVEVYYHLLDKDGNAKISLDELCAWLRSNERFKMVDDKSRFTAVCKAVELFKNTTKIKSQYISCEELKGLLIELGFKINVTSAFKAIDQDGNGKISFPEFLKWLNSELSSLLADDLGLTPRQVEVYYHLLDKDGNAKISPDELCAWLRSNERFNTLNDKSRFYAICKAVDLFRKYDKDGSQYISCEELKILLIEHGYNVDVKSAFNEIDQDGNGKISFPEFLKWLNEVKLN